MNDRAFFDLFLMNAASKYNLSDRSERLRSTKDLVALFYSIQDCAKPDISLEIGAYAAEFSINMKSKGVRAIAFEANPYNFNFFSQQDGIKKSGIEYKNIAIGKETGKVEFLVQSKVNGEAVKPVRGNNSLLKRIHGEIEYENVIAECTSLSDFFLSNGLSGKKFSAWIDVEGAAGDVLRGAASVFDTCLSVMIEVEQSPAWHGQILAHEIMDFFIMRNLLPVARDFEYPHQYNLVFLKKDLLENAMIREALVMHLARGTEDREDFGDIKK
jgi:FkbM family methyltransferase